MGSEPFSPNSATYFSFAFTNSADISVCVSCCCSLCAPLLDVESFAILADTENWPWVRRHGGQCAVVIKRAEEGGWRAIALFQAKDMGARNCLAVEGKEGAQGLP